MSELPPIDPSPTPFHKRSRGNLALLLIIAGGVILLVNSRILGAVVWNLLLPVMLIGVGLDLMTEGRQRRRIGTMAAVAAIALAPLIVGAHLIGRERMSMMSPMHRHEQIGSLKDIDRVEVHVALTAGEVSIDALPERSNAVVSLGEAGGRQHHLSRNGRTAVVRVDHPLNGGELELQLTRRVPVELKIEMGTGDLTSLDLSDIQLAKLDIEQTVGNAEVTLPDHGVMEINISNNLGDVEVDIPDELAARVEAITRLGDVDDRFQFENNVYLSDDYNDSAPNRAIVRITTTRGDITVQ